MNLVEIAGVPVNMLSEGELALQVRLDLVGSLAQQVSGTADLEEEPERPSKKSRTTGAMVQTMADKTDQVLFMLINRLAVTRVQETLEGTFKVLQKRSASSDDLQHLLGERALRNHLLFLDAAVDRCTSATLQNLRECGSSADVALATDESPPSQPRFRGLRF